MKSVQSRGSMRYATIWKWNSADGDGLCTITSNMGKLDLGLAMRKYVFIFAAWLLMCSTPGWADTDNDIASRIESGKKVAFDRSKGNCLACHLIEGGDLAGNFGPPLVMMQLRYPDRSILRDQIWDASVRIQTTTMPPFGRHRILTEDEIDLVVDFVLSL